MASGQMPIIVMSFVASEPIPKNRFVKAVTSTNKVALGTDDSMCIGVALHSATADGDVISVGLLGVFGIECVEAVAANLGLSCGTSGKGELSEADSPILGVALQDIAQDEVGMVLVIPVKALAIAS